MSSTEPIKFPELPPALANSRTGEVLAAMVAREEKTFSGKIPRELIFTQVCLLKLELYRAFPGLHHPTNELEKEAQKTFLQTLVRCIPEIGENFGAFQAFERNFVKDLVESMTKGN